MANGEQQKANSKGYTLYIDTSDKEAILRVYQDNKIVSELKWKSYQKLSETLSNKYSNILQNVGISQDNLKGICVFLGPGSFTGLRIGISFANGLSYGLGIPIYGTKKRGKVDLSVAHDIVVPYYDSPPKITKQKNKY